jgi:hypothetical protein
MTRTGQGTWLLTVLLMGLFVTNVDIAVINVATPYIHHALTYSPPPIWENTGRRTPTRSQDSES